MSNHENKQASEQGMEIMEATSVQPAPVAAAPITEGYEVLRNAEGKFQRRAVYQDWSSVHPETREEKIALLNLLNAGEGEEGGATGLNDYIGGEIKIADVIFRAYDSLNEDTGELTNGVLTYIFDTQGKAFVTSSKTVYFTLKRTFQIFGYPHYSEKDALTVKVVKKPGKDFKFIDLKILG